MANLKGSTFLARLAYLDAHFGEDGRRVIWQELSDDERRVLEGDLLPGAWYSREVFSRLVDLIDQKLGQGDYRVTRDMGYFAAGLQLKGAYDSFIRAGDPGFLLNRANSVWQLFHDFGRIDVKAEKNRCRIWLRDLGYPDIGMAEGIVGWAKQGLELSGCKEIRSSMRPASSVQGDAFEIRFAWRQ